VLYSSFLYFEFSFIFKWRGVIPTLISKKMAAPQDEKALLLSVMPDESVRDLFLKHPQLVCSLVSEERLQSIISPIKEVWTKHRHGRENKKSATREYRCSHCKKAGHIANKCIELCPCCNSPTGECKKKPASLKRPAKRQRQEEENLPPPSNSPQVSENSDDDDDE
jgi:hypothetical protein